MRRLILVLYALPAFALSIPTIPVYVYLPTFYAQTLGLGLAATGAALLVARLLDVAIDPLVGIASDRLRFRWGRRKPWILAGGIGAAVSLIVIMNPPDGVTVWFLGGWAVALYLGWTLISIPYSAWGAELSHEYHERSRITGAREIAQISGILIAGAVPPVVSQFGGGEQEGLAIVAWICVGIGVPSVFLLLWRVPDRAVPPHAGHDEMRRPSELIRELVRNKPFLRLLTAWFVNGLANGLPTVLLPLYLQFGLGASEAQKGLAIAVYFAAGVAAIPLWLHLSHRFGKHRTWCAAMIAACASFVWVPLLPTGAIVPFIAICVVTGMAFGADLTLPPSMQADVIDLDSLRTRRQRAGLFFALWAMAGKLALAVAVGFSFPVLELVGFQVEGNNDSRAITALVVIYALLPVVLKVFAIAMVWQHPINAARHAIIRKRLQQRVERALG